MKLTLDELQAIETEIVGAVSQICERNAIDYFLHCGSALGAVRHGGPIPWDTDVDIIIPINQFDSFLKAAREQLPKKFYIDYYDTNPDYPTLFPRIGLAGYSTQTLHVDIFKLIGTSSLKKEQRALVRKAKFYLQLFRLKTPLEKYYGKNVSLKMKAGAVLLKPAVMFISKAFIIRKFEELCNQYPFVQAQYVTNPSGGYGIKNVQKKSIYGAGTSWKYSGLTIKIPERFREYLQHYYGDFMRIPPAEERKIQNQYQLKPL